MRFEGMSERGVGRMAVVLLCLFCLCLFGSGLQKVSGVAVDGGHVCCATEVDSDQVKGDSVSRSFCGAEKLVVVVDHECHVSLEMVERLGVLLDNGAELAYASDCFVKQAPPPEPYISRYSPNAPPA